jgi:hypothetical protein
VTRKTKETHFLAILNIVLSKLAKFSQVIKNVLLLALGFCDHLSM